MPWFVYYRDLFRAVDLPSPVATVDDAVRVGLKLAKELLGTVHRHCIYEGPNELIIEYWSDGESVKLIDAEDPVVALEHYYEAEKAGLIKCTNVYKP